MKLTEKDLRLIKLYENFTKKDIDISLREYHNLLDALFFLHETLSESKILFKKWESFSGILMNKFYLHSYSFFTLLSGINIKSNLDTKLNAKILDISSAKILLRAQLETFLMYHHIYVNSINESEKELRFNAWIYSSLLERQSFPAESGYAKKQKIKDLKSIDQMKITIQKLDAFKRLTQKQQIGLLKIGSDKLFKKWDIIFKETGIGENNLIYNYYALLCSHAHSEGLSILQIKDSKIGYNNNDGDAFHCLFVSKLLICKMINEINTKHKDLFQKKYDSLSLEIKNLIELYSTIFKSLNS